MDLIEGSGLTDAPYHYRVGTPRETSRRGGHVAVEHEAGPRIARALKRRGVVPDFRPPDIARLAPIALYTSFHDCWQTVQHLKAIIDGAEHLKEAGERELVA